MSTLPEVFFHVGLAKAASTWLQYRVFPRLQGLRYIQRTRYRRSPGIIARGDHDRYLVSREFDRELEREVRWFAARVPQARPILVLRRHDSWLASQYRRHLKNARYASFAEFLDLTAPDAGAWRQEELRFMPRIRILEACFGSRPLVLFYDDLQADPFAFVDTLAEFAGTTYTRSGAMARRAHISYTEKQLKFMRALARKLPDKRRPHPKNPLAKWLRVRSRLVGVHLALYAASLAPARLVPAGPLIDPARLAEIREFFADDWEECRAFAASQPGAAGIEQVR